jgi:hypothetical protein
VSIFRPDYQSTKAKFFKSTSSGHKESKRNTLSFSFIPEKTFQQPS